MASAEGAASFGVSGEAYDSFMGRYSRPLAVAFADATGIAPNRRVLDVGCGPGALTAELVRLVGAASVSAVDPSESFVAACAERNPGVEVRQGRAEELPYPDGGFDAALAQLVLHFVTDPAAAAREMRRVVRPGGTVAACVWEFAGGMRMLRLFWDSALAVEPAAPAEQNVMRFGRDGEIADLFREAGLRDVSSGALEVEAAYSGFDELWGSFEGRVGPAGVYLASLDERRRGLVREELRARLGSPAGPFSLPARAWFAAGHA